MTDLKVWLTIPTGKDRGYLNNIIKDSQIPLDQIVIVHTIESEPIEGVRNVWDLDPPNIQRWWNRGIDIARANGGDYIAVLNDDLLLENNPINTIAQAMKDNDAILGFPHPHSGNGLTHVAGYCWVLDLKSGLRTDETLRWYFGDDDMLLQAIAVGKIINVPAVVHHLHGVTATNSSKYLVTLAKIDQVYFKEKWGKRFMRDNKNGIMKQTPLNQALVKFGLHGGWVPPDWNKDGPQFTV
jgi:hypothetical protein